MTNHLGEYLRDLRNAKGLTTRQLSQIAECSHSLVTLVEIGERSPSLDRLWRLVQSLDGNFPQSVFFLCLDSGVPVEVARELISGHRDEKPGRI